MVRIVNIIIERVSMDLSCHRIGSISLAHIITSVNRFQAREFDANAKCDEIPGYPGDTPLSIVSQSISLLEDRLAPFLADV